MMFTLRRAIVIAALSFVVIATAHGERGRGIVLRLPAGADTTALAEEWNQDLGRGFDLVAYSPAVGQSAAAIESFEIGAKAVFADGIAKAETAAKDLAPRVEWIIVDMRGESSPQAEALEALQDALADSEKFIGVIPPAESALDWAPAIAPHANAYFVPVPELTPEGLEALQFTAYTAARANGRCGIGCMLDATSITSTEDAQPILDFINNTDEFIKFFAIDWPEDPEIISDLVAWLNPRVEGPKPSLGMHQDRLRPPDRKLDPEVEARLMRWMGGISAVFFVVAVFVLFVWFKPVTRMPPENS